MSDTATGTVTTQTDLIPPATTTAPAVEPVEAVVTPTPETGTLLNGDEPKQEGDQPAADSKPAEPPKPEGAPEKYEFKAPDGVEYDPQVLETFSAAAKEANLPQEAAQKLIDAMAPKLAARQQEQLESIHKGWLEATKTDTEFGGDKLKESLGIAKTAYEKFSSPALRDLVEKTRFGDNPEFIRLFVKIGSAISEDKFVAGSPLKQAESPESVLYPTMTKK